MVSDIVLIQMKDKYDTLLEKTKEIQVIGQISMLLGWDTETKMPKGGVIQRSEQQAFVARLSHEKQTSPEIGKLLKEIQEHPDYEKLSNIEKRNIYL
ncbi:MAG: carboxypeptidase M32, partial [Candidatus Heimdallarchaeota archaeon]|nr:carboxypeptidase M32 [Candidatus Heimdallarchaeota archaeon]